MAKHIGPYLECPQCENDEWAVRMGLDGQLRFECTECSGKLNAQEVAILAQAIKVADVKRDAET